jgi:hypothetical protein
MALNLVDRTDARMDFLPKARKGIAIVAAAVLSMLEAVHQGLTVHDQLHLCARASVQVCQQQAKVLCQNSRTRVPKGNAHTDSEDPPVRGVLNSSCSGLSQVWIIHVFARPVGEYWPIWIPPNGVRKDRIAVDRTLKPRWLRCLWPRQPK